MNPKKNLIYYKDGNNVVCLLIDDKKAVTPHILARGVSILSWQDEPNVNKGADYALARANEAMGRKANCSPIVLNFLPEKDGTVKADNRDKVAISLSIDRFGPFKGFYKPKPTPTERLILTKKIKLFPIFKSKSNVSMQELTNIETQHNLASL